MLTRTDAKSCVSRTDAKSCVSTWRSLFATHLEAHGRSPATVRSYLADLADFTRWYECTNATPFTPDLTTGVDLRLYRQHNLEAGRIKPSTWNRRRATLAVFCAWLLDAGILTYNPFQGIDPWEVQELPPRWLDAREFSKFTRQLEININKNQTELQRRQSIRDAAMVSLMLYSGLREAEVVALNMEDLTLTARKGKITVRQGKGSKWRQVPLSNEARRALSAWVALASPTGPLFDGKRSLRLTTRSVQRIVAEIGRQAGVTVTPHDLRHTFAKRLLDAGRPITVVSKLMGHSRLETTARYVTPSWADYEKAVEGL